MFRKQFCKKNEIDFGDKCIDPDRMSEALTVHKHFMDGIYRDWGIRPPDTYIHKGKVYSLIGVGLMKNIASYVGLNKRRTLMINIGITPEGKKIYGTYYYGSDY